MIEKQDFAIIKAFIAENRSHRWIETNLMEVDSEKNKGFLARNRLIKYGFDGDFKNFLLNITSFEQFQNLLNKNKQLIDRNKVSEDLLKSVWENSKTIFLFQRVIQNTEKWLKPSVGRLGYIRDGEYLEVNGFGHEDWNFNKGLNIEGYVYGYLYYGPAAEKQNKTFNIAFGERLKGGVWTLAGFYKNAEFIEDGSPKNEMIINQKIFDLQELRKFKSIGNEWDLDEKKMTKKYMNELKALRWKVHVDDIVLLEKPVIIPDEFSIPDNKHIRNPSIIDQSLFQKLVNLGKDNSYESNQAVIEDDDARSFPEGRVMFVKHRKRERSEEVVRKAKASFLQKNGRLFCEVCKFDFETRYGDIGKEFIEAHHLIPVSKLKENEMTKISDLAMLCSNCHRMVHRSKELPADLHALRKRILNDQE